MPDTNEQIKAHDIAIRSREHTEITGVTNVVSFDDTSVCLETSMGEMMIEGEDIKVSALDTDRGRVVLDGKINGLYYNTETQTKKRGLFGKVIG